MKTNVIGGAGTYAAVGARLFCEPPHSSRVGWIVDAGSDFPEATRQIISSWQTGVLLRNRDGLTTRGFNAYEGGGDTRSFRYLTAKKQITADDLGDWLIRSRSFHLICSAQRCQTFVDDICRRRKEIALPRPLFVWEPVPDRCKEAQHEEIQSVLKTVDVISPNHEELAALFGTHHSANSIDKDMVEEQARQLLISGIGPSSEGLVVVRSGKAGAYSVSKSDSFWLPAYHTEQKLVVDPTGGGNGFLGGLALGLARQNDLQEAVMIGSVAASFCIEQVGPPVLTPGNADQEELWNHVSVQERLEHFRARVKSS